MLIAFPESIRISRHHHNAKLAVVKDRAPFVDDPVNTKLDAVAGNPTQRGEVVVDGVVHEEGVVRRKTGAD